MRIGLARAAVGAKHCCGDTKINHSPGRESTERPQPVVVSSNNSTEATLEVAATGEDQAATPGSRDPAWSLIRKRWTVRTFKAVVAIAFVIVFGWWPARTFFQTSSVEAVVNAPLLVFRAPIDGKIELARPIKIGEAAKAGEPLFIIRNERADRNRLDDMRRHRTRIEIERKTLAQRIDSLKSSLDTSKRSVERYQSWRAKLLQARIGEVELELEFVRSNVRVTKDAVKRSQHLARRRLMTRPNLEKAQIAHNQTNRREAILQRQLQTLRIERDAVIANVFASDSYNDRPASQQNAEDLTRLLGDLEAEHQDRLDRLERIEDAIAAEAVRFRKRQKDVLAAPTDGQIWEMHVMPGEEVLRGAELMRMVDCSGTVVSATVTKEVYNKLHLGAQVTFKPAGSGGDLAGRVVQLTGIASAASNFAIEPKALDKEPYRMLIHVPELSKTGRCGVGRTGRIVFHLSGSSAAQVSAARDAVSPATGASAMAGIFGLASTWLGFANVSAATESDPRERISRLSPCSSSKAQQRCKHWLTAL